MKSRLTRLQHWRLLFQRFANGFSRATIALVVAVIICGVAYAAVESGKAPPQFPWSWRAWVHWWNADRNAATIALFAAAGNAGSLYFGAFAVLWSKSAKQAKQAEQQHFEQLAKLEGGIDGKIDNVRDGIGILSEKFELIMHKLNEGRALGLSTDGNKVTESTERAVLELVRSRAQADQRAVALIADGQIAQGLSILRETALAADRGAAERWLQLGALAYHHDTEQAIAAYEKAALLDPSQLWTYINIGRLYVSREDYTSARVAIDKAIICAADDVIPRSVALEELANLQINEGDLSGAKKSIDESYHLFRLSGGMDVYDRTQRKLNISDTYYRLSRLALSQYDAITAHFTYARRVGILLQIASYTVDMRNIDEQKRFHAELEKINDGNCSRNF